MLIRLKKLRSATWLAAGLGRGGGAVSELGKLEDGYFSCRFRSNVRQ